MSKYRSMINDSIPMRDIVHTYLPDADIVDGRIQCPFHNGRDRNCAIYDKCFVCYVCGAKGGAVRFVSLLGDIGDTDAEKRINEDFNLGLPLGNKRTSLMEQITALDRLREYATKRRCEEIHKEAQEANFCLMWRVWSIARELRMEALEAVQNTGNYPQWASQAFALWDWIDNEIKEGGDWSWT